MGLEGSLSTFGLADIFQLIGLQKKTGYLTITGPNDVVTITFYNGNVVGADSLNKRIEGRLGHVLEKSGKISKEELNKALEIQKQTLQRLGYILVSNGFITPDALRSALTTQMTQTIYSLFRWREGTYNFEQKDTVEYDKEYVIPMSAEGILMEGIRMLDEWPFIEKKIPRMDMVFEKVPVTAPIVLKEDEDSFSPLTAELGMEIPTVKTDTPSDAIRLSSHEMNVYHFINGVFTMQEIIDRTGLSEFDACKAMFELLNRQLVRELREESLELETEIPKKSILKIASFVVPYFISIWIILVFLYFLSAGILKWPISAPLTKHGRDHLIILSKNRMERIASALQAYYIQNNGEYPSTLDNLVEKKLINGRETVTPFGAYYYYEKTPNGYILSSGDEKNKSSEALTIISRP